MYCYCYILCGDSSIHSFLGLLYAQHAGELKGTDQFGNEYYENREARVPGRHRFVVYKNVKDFHHDATGVPPEWHSWLCHMYDETPVEDPPSKPFFQLQHKQYNPNQMGLNANYLPPNHFLRLNTPAQPKYKSWYDKEEGTLITGKTDVDEDTKKLDSK